MEVAAGVIAAEQVISTTLEGGIVAGVALAQPTQPLKATFTGFASSPDNDGLDSLQRSAHTITVLNGKAYIFGGTTPGGDYASNDIHIVTLPDPSPASNKEYQCIPPLSAQENGQLPPKMANHTACAIGDVILFYGGTENPSGFVEGVWEFDTKTLRWTKGGEQEAGGAVPPTRHSHNAVVHQDAMIIHGGVSAKEEPLNDAWIFYTPFQGWTEMPSPPVSAQQSSLAVVDDVLYLIEHSTSHIDTIHRLQLKVRDSVWQTITLPSSPEQPIPESRTGSQLIPISTGHGRNYILQLFGVKHTPLETLSSEQAYLSDMWTLQLPSSSTSVTKLKDSTRETLNFFSGEFSWGKVEVVARDQEVASEGKSLPGPLAHFAVSSIDDKTVLLWGGVDATGKTVGDGWLLKLE
ncbi:hypothetical protein EJ08DRAFT_610606 [Tothia fuscella]|uniref:Galactose oxidase n=1 Tax=Tothia fuscella TaxID=1048955 RepID=A0A9P4U055_9PEZI|nr:hypothetical protein EJ08DRAFT_610606 [Tothia fuscella]